MVPPAPVKTCLTAVVLLATLAPPLAFLQLLQDLIRKKVFGLCLGCGQNTQPIKDPAPGLAVDQFHLDAGLWCQDKNPNDSR